MVTFEILDNYCYYLSSVLNRSKISVRNYSGDVCLFFKYWKKKKRLCSAKGEVDISNITVKNIRKVSSEDIISYLVHLENKEGICSSSRARKLSALKSFFKYCHQQKKIIDIDPTANIGGPKLGQRQPKYLTLEESQELLHAAYESGSKNNERNYCIVVIFLNCGIRLAELRGINVKDIHGNKLTVIGKGNKERTVYLTDACLDALKDWEDKRKNIKIDKNDQDALFVSNRGKRISDDAVQYAVKKLFAEIGLDTTKYSVHKLRHTAATLMYKYGNADIRSLCAILGHESVSTTQIYTHVDEEELRQVVRSNPLAAFSPD